MSSSIHQYHFVLQRLERLLLLLSFLNVVIWSFSLSTNNRERIRYGSSVLIKQSSLSPTQLHLIPLRTFQQESCFPSSLYNNDKTACLDSNGTFRSDPSYELCVVEEDDLPDTARFVVQAFGSEAIRMSNDMGSFEQFILRPTVELLNGYSGIVAFAEVLAGLRSRIRLRLVDQLGIQGPILDDLNEQEQVTKVAGTALVLVLAKRKKQETNTNWRIEIIGSVELRLQPCDAKIPFTLPWLDRIERRLASLLGHSKTDDLYQPYLSNLCVAEEYRGQKIGRALIQSVEEIASSVWGYSRIYLHVDVDNTPAYQLYTSAGYKDVGKRWKPFWAGSAADIGYFVKKLK